MEIKGKIVFASGKQGDYDIWRLDLESGELKQLTSGTYWNDAPKWSPDGEKIVFVSSRTGTPEIWMMEDDGENQVRLTKRERWHNTPAWSPDGKRIVFCANYAGNLDIWVMNSDGSGSPEQITDYPGIDFTPQWSPNGKKIIFSSERTGNDDIWTYDIATKELKQLAAHKARDFSPAYSPDGSLIAFVSGREAPDPKKMIEKLKSDLDIWLMNEDGSNVRRITTNFGTDRFVSWSPDGEYLIYTSAPSTTTSERLQVIKLTEGKPEEIRFDRGPLEAEIKAEVPRGIFLFKLLPKKIRRKFSSKDYFGTERYPDWKF